MQMTALAFANDGEYLLNSTELTFAERRPFESSDRTTDR